MTRFAPPRSLWERELRNRRFQRSARTAPPATSFRDPTAPRRQAGVTLVELIVSIVVIGVALAGVLSVFVRTTGASADPVIWHQSVAIAEAYLEEILAKEFTDPGGGPEARASFDNVMDYNVLTDVGARDQSNTPILGLEGYTVNVQVTGEALNGIAAANVWRVQVTVTPPFGGNIVISGYRTNY